MRQKCNKATQRSHLEKDFLTCHARQESYITYIAFGCIASILIASGLINTQIFVKDVYMA